MDTFDWTRAHTFLIAFEEGSFSAAARRLKVSQPTVGRQVAALEAELQIVLFERVGGTLHLTDAGKQVAAHIRSMQQGAHQVLLAAAQTSGSLTGRVCISASDLIAVSLLTPVLAAIPRTYPGIQVDIVTTNDVSDLARREADIAIRHVRPVQPDLVARKLADTMAHMYASPSYLAQLGPIRTVADLQRAQFIGFDRSPVMIETLAASGLQLTDAHFPFATSSSVLQVELARQGAGVCFVVDRIGAADPGLRPVLPEHVALPVPLWLVCHRELRTTPRFRVVFDALVDGLR